MSIKLEMVAIYILELEDGKYYIGRSKAKTDKGILSRINKHYLQTQTAAAWCIKYKPIKTIEIKQEQTIYDENKWTKVYMGKYGIDNVRGGDYVRIKLPTEQVKSLQREIDGANDKCHSCGKKGHFIRFCPNKRVSVINIEKNKEIKEIKEETVWECEYCLKHYETEKMCEKCEIIHENNKVLNNLLRRFKNIHYGDIKKLCIKHNYFGGLVAKELNNSIFRLNRKKIYF